MAVDPKIFRKIEQFRNFHPATLEELSKTALVADCKKGETIFSVGDCDEKEVFLVYGSVRLHSTDNHTIIINQNDPEAKFGLSSIKPRRYTAIADSYNTCVMYIHDKILSYLIKKNKEQHQYGIYSEIIPDRRTKQR